MARLRYRRSRPPIAVHTVTSPRTIRYDSAAHRVDSGHRRTSDPIAFAAIAGRRSPLSLYDKSLATYDEGDAFDHASAVGFIEIFGLPLRVEAARHGAVGKRHGAAWT